MPLAISEHPGGSKLSVKVVPGASRDRIMGPLGDALKLAVSKPPQDGAANRAVVALLAAALDLPPKQVEILRGHTSPRKEVFVRGLTPQQVAERLKEA